MKRITTAIIALATTMLLFTSQANAASVGPDGWSMYDRQGVERAVKRERIKRILSKFSSRYFDNFIERSENGRDYSRIKYIISERGNLKRHFARIRKEIRVDDVDDGGEFGGGGEIVPIPPAIVLMLSATAVLGGIGARRRKSGVARA